MPNGELAKRTATQSGALAARTDQDYDVQADPGTLAGNQAELAAAQATPDTTGLQKMLTPEFLIKLGLLI